MSAFHLSIPPQTDLIEPATGKSVVIKGFGTCGKRSIKSSSDFPLYIPVVVTTKRGRRQGASIKRCRVPCHPAKHIRAATYERGGNRCARFTA